MLTFGWSNRRWRDLKAAVRAVRHRLYSTQEIRMYVCELEAIYDNPAPTRPIHVDTREDVNAFDAAVSWMDIDQFRTQAARRLQAGEHVYTIVERGRLVHYGWLVAPVCRKYISEVGTVAEFPVGSTYAYDFFTHPDSRNRGHYQASLRHMQSEAKWRWRASKFYIGVTPENVGSVHVIEKVGFRYDHSLFQRWRWNRVRRWSTKVQTALSHDNTG